MKGLTQFMKFDWDEFANGKQFLVISTSEYQDFDTKTHLGTKIECVISSDKTVYKYREGEKFSNRFEKIIFKVGKDVNAPVNSYILPKNAVATIYGEYRNQLSVKCDDIDMVTAKEK